MVNALAMDFLSGSEADDLDLTLEGAGKKKKKHKKKAPKAPIAGYDAATGQPIYDEIISYDTRTGKPIYAQQQARLQQLQAGYGTPQYDAYGQPMTAADGSLLGGLQAFDDFGNPIAPRPAVPIPGMAPPQYGQPLPPPPPGWSPQMWAQYQFMLQQREQAAQGPGMFALYSGAYESGGPAPLGPAQPGYYDQGYEAIGGALDQDEGTAFYEAGDFDALGGAEGDLAPSPIFKALSAPVAQVQPARTQRLERADEGRPSRAEALGFTRDKSGRDEAAQLPFLRAVAGSGCCNCQQYRKYPERDALRNPFQPVPA